MKIAVCLYGSYSNWYKLNHYDCDMFAFSLDKMENQSDFVESSYLRESLSDAIPNLNSHPQSSRRVVLYDYCCTRLEKMVTEYCAKIGEEYDILIFTTFSNILLEFPFFPGIYYTRYYSFHQFPYFPPSLNSIEIVSNSCVRKNGGNVQSFYDLNENDLKMLLRIMFKNKVKMFRDYFTEPGGKIDTDIKYETAFMIPSVISTSNLPFDYSLYRSVFTPAERFNQTLEQVKSIESIPNTVSFLLEGSALDLNQLRLLSKHTFVILFYKDYHGNHYANKHPNKSIYEIYVLQQMIPLINSKWYLKFGGRYRLTEYFDINDFKHNLPCVKTIQKEATLSKKSTIIECILYSFPEEYKDEFLEIYEKIMEVVQNLPEGIETLLYEYISSFKNLEFLNIIGRDAIESFDRLV